MNIKTKFKLGDTVYAVVKNTPCRECGKPPTQATERVEFEVERITIHLYDYQPPNISYSDSCGLAGWFEEHELKRVR